MVAKSKTGSRWTWVRPASASARGAACRRRRLGEGRVGAALARRDRLVVDARSRGHGARRSTMSSGVADGGFVQVVPAGRRERRLGEVDDLAAGASSSASATEYGSVTEVVLDLPGGRREHLDVVQVELALPGGRTPSTLHTPVASSRVIAMRRWTSPSWRPSYRLQLDGLRGRCPQADRRRAAAASSRRGRRVG